MTEHKEQISLFNSIEDILQYFKFRYCEEEKDVHLMLFDPQDGCYHSYLTSSTEKATEEQVKKVIDNSLKDYQYKDKLRKWINKNVRKSDEKNLALDVIQAAENNKKGEQYTLPQDFFHETSRRKALQIILSSLPSYYRWDICGYYDRHYQQAPYPFSIWWADSLDDTDEYMLSSFAFLEEPIKVDEELSIRDFEALRKSSRFEEIIFKENYQSFQIKHIGSNYLHEKGFYDELYDKLRKVLYAGEFDRSIYAPASLSQLYIGLIYIPFPFFKDGEEVDLKKFGKYASDFRLEKHRDFLSSLEKLWLTEFDKMMFKNISIYDSNDKVMEYFCYNINYIVKCEKCLLIKHKSDDGIQRQTEWGWSERDNSIFREFKSTTSEIALEELKKNIEVLDGKNGSYNFFQDEYVVIHVEYQVKKDKYSLYLLTQDNKKLKEEKHINLLKSIIQHRKQLLYQILQNIGSSLFPQIEAIKKYGTKAAVSAIIARNHSHHIGSHVICRTSVDQIQEKLKKRVDQIQEKLEKRKENHDYHIKVIDCLKTRLDKYIQKKGDFSSEIATEPLFTTKTLSFYTEVIVPFITNTLLMDNLCSNEGIGYPKEKDYGNRLKIIFKHGDEFIPKFSCKRESKCKDCNLSESEYPYSASCSKDDCGEELEFEEIGNQKDIKIAVPGPLGEYALYSFLENFIRNAAKHNRKKLERNINKNLEIRIEISEIEDEDIKNNGDFFKEGDKYEFYKIEIWDNVTRPFSNIRKRKLVNFINDRIKDPIINKDGSIRKGAWGIAEMKIMATLLRGSDNFLKLHESLLANAERMGDENFLVYVFKIMKPKKVAVISESFSETDKHKKYGIRGFKTIKEFIEFMKHALCLASFEFLIIDNKQDLVEKYKEMESVAPFRILATNTSPPIINNKVKSIESGFFQQIIKSPPEELYINVWRKWIEKTKESKKNDLCIVVYLDQKEKSEPPTRDWDKHSKKFNAVENNPVKLHVMDSGTMKAPDNSAIIMYDRHFGAYNSLKKKNNVLFHELIDKNSSDFTHVFIPPNEVTVYELAESGLHSILIIDERIAERAYDEIMAIDSSNASAAYKGLTRLHAARAGGIFICTHLNRNKNKVPEPIHHSVKEHYEQYNKKTIKIEVNLCIEGRDSPPTIFLYKKKNGKVSSKKIPLPDILIIHQGIMENFIEGIDNYDSFIDRLKKHIPYVVVTSGRGIPPNLPDTAKFLPISLLEGYVMGERLAKYCLVKFLMALNRRKK